MEASNILWEKWQEQVKELLPDGHGHQKKSLALSVIGIVLAKSAVLQRMAVETDKFASSTGNHARSGTDLASICSH